METGLTTLPHLEHYFANVRAALHQSVGRGGFGKQKRLIDYRPRFTKNGSEEPF